MTKFSVKERTTNVYQADLQDPNGVAIPAVDLTTLTLTLYDKVTGTVLNGRTAQDVLNANNVTVDSAGRLIWTLQPADTAIVTPAKELETHVALFEFTWQAGAKRHWHAVTFEVENQVRIS